MGVDGAVRSEILGDCTGGISERFARASQRLARARGRVLAREGVRSLPVQGPHPSSGFCAGRGRTAGGATSFRALSAPAEKGPGGRSVLAGEGVFAGHRGRRPGRVAPGRRRLRLRRPDRQSCRSVERGPHPDLPLRQRKRGPGGPLLRWRRGRDSNPRSVAAYTLSRRAPSTARPPLPNEARRLAQGCLARNERGTFATIRPGREESDGVRHGDVAGTASLL